MTESPKPPKPRLRVRMSPLWWVLLAMGGISGSIVTVELCEAQQCPNGQCPRPMAPRQFQGNTGPAWPPECRDLDFYYSLNLNLPQDQIRDSVAKAVAKLNSASGIQIRVTADLGEAEIVARSAPIRGSALAWSYLPSGSCQDVVQQRYNTRVNWNPDWLARVVLHELGHAVGLGHSSSVADVMYPSQAPQGNGGRTLESFPGPGDLAALQAKYGPPVADPVPDPDPDPEPGGEYVTRAEFLEAIRELKALIEANR